jgi:hypothetical protein
LVALFAVVYGARLWLVDDFGSAVPFWDEWDVEGGNLFKPFLLGHLPLSKFFECQGEHRIVLTRLLEFGLFRTNGMWDPRMEMVVNATIAAGTASLVAYLLLLEMGWEWWRPVISTVAVLWSLPYASENTLWGIQSLFYFLVLFSFTALWGLSHGPPFTGRWWCGTASLVLACLTMASGLVAGLAVAAIRCWAIALDRRTWRTHGLTLLAGVACVGISLMFVHHVPEHESLKAQGPLYFLLALFKNLSWPVRHLAGRIAFLICLVPLFVSARTLMQEKGRQPARWFVLSLAIWAGMQAGVLAYGRGVNGQAPASRYQDILAMGLLASSMALLLEWPRINRWLRYGWLLFVIVPLVQTAHRDFRETLPHTHQQKVEQERRCLSYVESRDPAILRDAPDRLDIPYSKPDKLARYLDDPQLRSILLFIPGHEGQAGWPTQISKVLLQSSRAIFSLGVLWLCAIFWRQWLAMLRKYHAGFSPQPPPRKPTG